LEAGQGQEGVLAKPTFSVAGIDLKVVGEFFLHITTWTCCLLFLGREEYQDSVTLGRNNQGFAPVMVLQCNLMFPFAAWLT